jgi:putative redox protein
LSDASAAVDWSGPRTVTVDRPESSDELRIGFNGGEFLFMAIDACYTNDLYREAAKRCFQFKSVRVDVEGDWGGDPIRAQNMLYEVRVEAVESEKEILDLIEHTDKVVEIHNSLRMGTVVILGKSEAVPD